jgi:hypothetical protein
VCWPIRSARAAGARPLLPLGRSEVGVAELDGKVYVVGG